MTNVSIIYYSATGNVHKLAVAMGEGAAAAGADVRIRRVAELAPAQAIEQNDKWKQHLAWATEHVHEATLDDLEWGHGIALGSPTRFGLPAAQLKQLRDPVQKVPLSG